MVSRQDVLRAASLTTILCAGFALIGCQSMREAFGVTKQAPDEFAVLTKPPLVIPPDFNLRPPQPGVASRYELDAAVQAQRALFPHSAATQTAMLDDTYSDGEKLLLSKANALNASVDIRRIISADAGQEDQGPEFARKILQEDAAPQPPAMGSEDTADTAEDDRAPPRPDYKDAPEMAVASEIFANAAPAPTDAMNATQIDQPSAPIGNAGVLEMAVASEAFANAAQASSNAESHIKLAVSRVAAARPARRNVAATAPLVPAPEGLLLRPAYDR